MIYKKIMIQERLDNYKKKKRLEFLNYDKKRHIALLKKKSLLKENCDKDELSKDSSELRSYSTLLNLQLDWETQDEFLSLIENFLEHKTGIGDFQDKFCERALLNDDVGTILESNLILLSLHPNSFDFGEIIEEIFGESQLFDGEETDAENNFYNFINEKFLEIQTYLN